MDGPLAILSALFSKFAIGYHAAGLLAQGVDPTATALSGMDGSTMVDTGEGFSFQKFLALGLAFAIMILPFVVGPMIARKFKMPTYGTRFATILLAIFGSIAVLISQLPKLGVDLRGGTILVYEIDTSKIKNSENDLVSSEDLVKPLTDRINPAGTQEIVIRPYGEKQIEVIIPEVDQIEVARIKKKLAEAGILRFAIVANQTDHLGQITLATDQANFENPIKRKAVSVANEDGDVVALWAEVSRESAKVDSARPLRVDVATATLRNPSTGELVSLPRELFVAKPDETNRNIAQFIDSQNMPSLEILMIVNPDLDVTGEDLDFASSQLDQSGAPAVSFRLTNEGGAKFYVLTQNNIPTGTTTRQLGIILDDTLLSAPNIQSAIRTDGQITGNFTSEEVDSLVSVLRAGKLPAALNPTPIAENEVGATLGRDTIVKGFIAIAVSISLVLVFILFYYRLIGVIACLALVMNLAMILATMVLINQPLTLPGLAGLVLTVGMSVDANVLIFERIREEVKKGAADRMAVRNGFAKATVTIVDANLTTLITAIVLYAIGTDQIRGFAVTLILGILFSMFTAIYVSRTFFDLAERHHKLSLRMSDMVNSIRESVSGGGVIDFISKGGVSLAFSSVVVLIGIGAIYARGSSIFDIDFNGGSSVQFQTNAPAKTDEIRLAIQPVMKGADGSELPFTVNNVTMQSAPEGTVFKVDSSFEEVEQLQAAIVAAFEQSSDIGLVTGQAKVVQPDTMDQSSVLPNRYQPNSIDRDAAPAVRLVAMQGDVAADDEMSAGDQDGSSNDDSMDGDDSMDEIAIDATGDDAKPGDMDSANVDGDGDSEPNLDNMITRTIAFGDGQGAGDLNAATLRFELMEAATRLGIPLTERGISLNPIGDGVDDWNDESALRFAKWEVAVSDDLAITDQIVSELTSSLNGKPVWISSNSVGARVAGDMIQRAFVALFASLLCIIGYIWFRFQRIVYGLAAVVALVHDVLVTLGAIAISYWVADFLGFLLIDQFKISLTVVAAILTIIGYSLNDTIVVFDRIRETKGKARRLTGEMINISINQTLSRTLLTSITTLIVVLLLYLFGGAGIHAFAFALVIGVMVGTYSSIFVASPVLHYLIQRGDAEPATT